MVTRINGAPRQGVWFSSDVVFVEVTSVGTTYLTDLTVAATGVTPRQADLVNSDLEVALEALSVRGTVIGLTVESDTVFTAIVDYGQALDPDNVTLGNQTAQDINAEIDAEIVANSGASATAIVVSRGFGIATPGTPA